MVKWLEQVPQWHQMYCHDLEVMDLNPNQVELGVRIAYFYVVPESNIQLLQKWLIVNSNVVLEQIYAILNILPIQDTSYQPLTRTQQEMH